MVYLRLPNITGATPAAQVEQMKSFLFQTITELNLALNNIDSAKSGDTSKVELSNKSNPLTPEEAKKTFNAVKSLIIKSADIVKAFSDEFTKNFNSLYVAKSDFGDYVEETKGTLEATASILSQNISQIEAIGDSLGDLYGEPESIIKDENKSVLIRKTNAWIKTGYLGDDDSGNGIYGVEVGRITEENGEEVFSKYARFLPNGIYFYLVGTDAPIAYMSNQKLYILNAEILSTIKLGGYELDLTKGIAFRWVGRG